MVLTKAKHLLRTRCLFKSITKNCKTALFDSKCYCSTELNYVESNKHDAKLKTSTPGLLESWFYEVETFGKINVSVPFSLNIESLDPQEYPNMGKLFIKLNYLQEDEKLQLDQYNNASLAALTKLYEFDIDRTDINTLNINARFKTMATFPATCTIQMPLNFDLCVECSGKSTFVKNLEANNIYISTSNSTCNLHNIKGENVTILGKQSDIICTKVLQGNTDITVTGKGDIKTDRLQGQNIKCSVENGNIATSSVYSQSSEFTCNHGNINLMNVHGAAKTSVKEGNLVIDSLDGSLESVVQNGTTDIFISRPEDVNIETTKGDIIIKLSDNSTSVDLEGQSVKCDEKLQLIDEKIEKTENKEKLTGYLSGKDGQIKAKTKEGNISLKYLNWMESLKLQQKK